MARKKVELSDAEQELIKLVRGEAEQNYSVQIGRYSDDTLIVNFHARRKPIVDVEEMASTFDEAWEKISKARKGRE